MGKLFKIILVLSCLFCVSQTSFSQIMPPPAVAIEQAVNTDLQASRRYTGLLTSEETVNVTSEVAGKVLEISYDEGTNVKKGQLLYRIDDVKYKAAVKASQAKVAQLEANLAYAEKTYERKKILFGKKASSAEDFDLAKSNFAALTANLAAAKAELIVAKKDLKETKIMAPLAGRIGDKDISAGNYVSPDLTLTTIVKMDPLILKFTMSNRDFLKMFGDEAGFRENAVIRIKLADESWYEYEGEVDHLGNQANQKTDSVWIYIKIKNPRSKLLPGSTVTTYLSKKGNISRVAVKLSAIMHDAESAYVFVVNKDNVVERRNVELEFSDGFLQVLKSGLEVGEKVIVQGVHKVQVGGAVMPVNDKVSDKSKK